MSFPEKFTNFVQKQKGERILVTTNLGETVTEYQLTGEVSKEGYLIGRLIYQGIVTLIQKELRMVDSIKEYGENGLEEFEKYLESLKKRKNQ